MNNIYKIFMAGFILIITSTSCLRKENNNLKNEFLFGSWVSPINTAMIEGFDTLTFQKDNLLKDSKRVVYHGSDSGFNFSISFATTVNGTWAVRNDSIFVKFIPNSLNLRFDKKSFSIKGQEGADEKTLELLKPEMYKQICNFLKNGISQEYAGLAIDPVLLGKVLNLTNKELTIINAGNVTVLRQAHK